MGIKKLLQIFLGSWAVLIFLIFLTDAQTGLSPVLQVVCTGVLAGLVTLLAVVATRGEKNKKQYSVCDPATGQVICRVEGEWIFKGSEEKASWYIKRGAVYGFENMKPLYHIKDNKVRREGESEPFLTMEETKITACADGRVVYEVR